jgi:hypothetical protein
MIDGGMIKKKENPTIGSSIVGKDLKKEGLFILQYKSFPIPRYVDQWQSQRV